jgi:hypothetical protein
MKFIYTFVAIAVIGPGGVARAAETVVYSYDALGRLKQSTKAGGPHSGSQTTTSYDPAGNRACQSTTGVPVGPATPACPPPPPP